MLIRRIAERAPSAYLFGVPSGVAGRRGWSTCGDGMAGKAPSVAVDRAAFEELQKKHERFLTNPRTGNRMLIAGAVIEGVQTTAVDLRGSCFINVTFQDCSFWRTNFEEADFELSALKQTSLESSSLRRAKMRGVQMRGANLKQVDLTDADVGPAVLTLAGDMPRP